MRAASPALQARLRKETQGRRPRRRRRDERPRPLIYSFIHSSSASRRRRTCQKPRVLASEGSAWSSEMSPKMPAVAWRVVSRHKLFE